MGKETAELVQKAVEGAAGKSTSIVASFTGIVTLIIAASGVFWRDAVRPQCNMEGGSTL